MGLSIQENKFKIDFQDVNCAGHLVFPVGTILAIFDLQVTSMTLAKFQVNWPFGSGEEAKNWPFGSGEEAKNRFSRRLPCSNLGFPI